MKRYNQGFVKFGPMEQCDDGEWVKYEDVVDLCAEQQYYNREDANNLLVEITELRAKTIDLAVFAYCLGFIAIIEFGIILFK